MKGAMPFDQIAFLTNAQKIEGTETWSSGACTINVLHTHQFDSRAP